VILLRLDQTRPFDSAAPAASSGSTPRPPGPSLRHGHLFDLRSEAVGDGLPFLDAQSLDSHTLFSSPPLIGHSLALDA
jgi:hypothetical protein